MRATSTIALIALAGTVGACAAGGQPRIPRERIDRALASTQYTAQPSLVVAREIEFARAARENGQWTAFRDFAADGALLHGRNGPVPAQAVLATLENPPTAVQWSPRTVMMSCDGRMAVSTGRFRDPEGLVGDFVTVWTRERTDGEYKWAYDAGGYDDPQPAPVEREEGEIVVNAYDAVQGLVADCPKNGASVPAPPALGLAGDVKRGEQISRDGTLRWVWEHSVDGTKHVRADYYTSGAWETIVDKRLVSPPED